jgi:epoxyqueuosine reductase
VSHPTPNPNPSSPARSGIDPSRARALALDAGFTEAGLVALPYPESERDADRFSSWIGAGRAASMRYLERVAEDGRLIRARVETPFPWARSAIVCFASYASPSEPLSTDTTLDQGDSLTGNPDKPVHSKTHEDDSSFSGSTSSPVLPTKEPSRRTGKELNPEHWMSEETGPTHLSTKTQEARSGWIARYAWSSRLDSTGKRVPSDYHKVLLKRLNALDARLRAEFSDFESRAYVDTGPVVERSLAVAAGLGWTGKNTCLIHPRLGSFGFLAVLLTSLELSESAKDSGVSGISEVRKNKSEAVVALPHPDRCGTCTRCIEACPTHALDTPYQMDANRCIAYLTIEHKGPIAEELMPGIGRQVFGCDICQDVCPWNRKAFRSGPIQIDPDLTPRPELINPALDWLASLDEQAFERLFNGSPVRRTGFNGLRRNLAIAMGNSGLAACGPKLKEWADAADEGLHSAARWALAKLSRQDPSSTHPAP